MSYTAILIIASILLVIVRANNKRINSWTIFLCIAILGSSVFVVGNFVYPQYDYSNLQIALIHLIPPIVIIILAFWLGKVLRCDDDRKRVMTRRTNKKGAMSNKTNEELAKIVSDFQTSSLYHKSIQHQSSSSDEDLPLTPEDFIELVNFSAALQEMKERGMIEGEIPSITLNMTPASEDDDSDYVFNKSK